MDAQQLKELLAPHADPAAAVKALRDKQLPVPPWETPAGGLRREYEPALHPVMDRALYPDRPDGRGGIERVTRVTLNFQRLAARRMAELSVGTPVKRVYDPENPRQQEIAAYLENILTAARVDTMNYDRCLALFAACEVATIWYALPQPNVKYGFKSQMRLRARILSPLRGDALYPVFDGYGDMIALSVGRREQTPAGERLTLDAYTADAHLRYEDQGDGWRLAAAEPITLGKIPAAYMWRPEPIWEHTSRIVEEMEWTLSRNGNYLRKNSKPLFAVFADEMIPFGREDSPDGESRAVLQFPKGCTAGYVTWPQAVDSLKFHIAELRQAFFTQLQLPDWSYESMKSVPMSGESRKQLFIDAHLKVLAERGRLQEFFDREVNVLKGFLAAMLPAPYAEDIEALRVYSEIAPFALGDDRETIANLTAANGGKPLISQRESVELLGWSSSAARTLEEMRAEAREDAFTLTD